MDGVARDAERGSSAQLRLVAGGPPAAWCKIFIMGPPGSGKTFWAQRLAVATRLPRYELDRWFLLPETDPERKRWQAALLAQDEWIVEGIYPWPDAMRAADAVFVLRPPWWVRDFRIVWRRYLKPALVKVAVTAGSLAATLYTSHHYASNHLARSRSAAAAVGIPLITVATGQNLVRQVLAHRPPVVERGRSQPILTCQGEDVLGEALRTGVSVVRPPAGLASNRGEGEE